MLKVIKVKESCVKWCVKWCVKCESVRLLEKLNVTKKVKRFFKSKNCFEIEIYDFLCFALCLSFEWIIQFNCVLNSLINLN